MRKCTLGLGAAGLLLALVAGCGGGGGAATTTAPVSGSADGRVEVTIDWSEADQVARAATRALPLFTRSAVVSATFKNWTWDNEYKQWVQESKVVSNAVNRNGNTTSATVVVGSIWPQDNVELRAVVYSEEQSIPYTGKLVNGQALARGSTTVTVKEAVALPVAIRLLRAPHGAADLPQYLRSVPIGSGTRPSVLRPGVVAATGGVWLFGSNGGFSTVMACYAYPRVDASGPATYSAGGNEGDFFEVDEAATIVYAARGDSLYYSNYTTVAGGARSVDGLKNACGLGMCKVATGRGRQDDLEGSLARVLCIADRGGQSVTMLYPPYDNKSLVRFGRDRMKTPTGLAVSPAGRIYVADDGAACVWIYQLNGRKADFVGSLVLPPGGTFHPFGVAVDSFGSVYVTDSAQQCFYKFAWNGACLARLSGAGTKADQFQRIGGITVAPDNSVCVVDYSADSPKVSIWDYFN